MYSSPMVFPLQLVFFNFVSVYNSPPCPFQSFRSTLISMLFFQSCHLSFYLTNVLVNPFFHDFSPSYCLQFKFSQVTCVPQETDFRIPCPYGSPHPPHHSLYNFPVIPSHLLYISPVPLSAPVLPCAYPLSSLAFVRHHLCTYCHLQFSPVTPCTCFYHLLLSPSFPVWSLLAQ